MTFPTRFGLLAIVTPLLLTGALYGTTPAPTFSKDVWPILQNRCVNCHQPGEIGPMPLTSYEQARPWASAISEAVRSRTMPPWHATAGVHQMRNDRSLSAREIETITAWVNTGSAEGSPIKAFVPPVRKTNWKLGTPDRVVQVPGFQVPKTGALPYSFLIVPLHFDHDVWIKAAEFRIDQRAVIHHMNAFVRPPNSSYLAGFPTQQILTPTIADRAKRKEGERIFDRRELLLGYEPGYFPQPWLDDGAKLIRAGSDIVFEMHYNPNGKEVTDHSEFALYFAKEAPVNRVLAIDTLRDLNLLIPPGDRDYESSAAMTLASPVRLLSIQPHMHVRGKRMEVRATYPDGKMEDLINVPKYDFQWQTTYVFTDPLNLPIGTRLESIAGYDNSTNNGFNPDPKATVKWGDQTTDEMHIAFLEIVVNAKADIEKILLERPQMLTPAQKALLSDPAAQSAPAQKP